MKKIIAIALAICALLSLAGCITIDGVEKGASSVASGAQQTPAETETQKSAVNKVEKYLEVKGYSYDELVEKLTQDGVSPEDAKYAAEKLDYNAQALRRAKANLETMAYSYNGLLSKLKHEKFTDEQAKSAVDGCGADWNQQAVRKAEAYKSLGDFPMEDLEYQLTVTDGFTNEQAAYAASQVK